MLIDATLVLSDKQALTSSCASENIIDQAAAGDSCAHAMVVAQTVEDFAGLNGLKISLQTSDQSDFGVWKDLAEASFETEDLKGGKTLLKMVLPLGAKRYIRGYYSVTGTATAGKLSLFVTGITDM
ncbi:MAG: hypothetical protein IKB61_03770 [Elusimicrobiaceae bacterium]|nr:hypothetical protein [Elusimicrobiaceae bacterium]MBR2505040.1 hypothetical protein [Elusimicrobiaceae bacterium]MBR5609828.1 hypothetical protein [Elusimicrobiaceae bacterium]